MGVAGGEGRLQPHHPHGALLQAPSLLLGAVGGVVRGDHVDGAVLYPLDEGRAVLPGPEGRVHLEPAVLLQILVAVDQVVGTHLAGHVHPPGLGLPDDLDALLGGHVADVVLHPGLRRQLQVPGDLAPLALGADAPVAVLPGVGPVVDVPAAEEGIVLAVGGDDLVQPFGLRHGGAHQLRALDPPAVVREPRRIRGHGFQVRQGLALLPPGDGPVGVDMDHRVPADDLQLLLQVLPAVRHRIQVRHGAHVGEAPPGGCQGAGADGLLIRKSRLSQMNVHINETGKHCGIMKINGNGGSGGLQPLGNGNDTAVTDENVGQMKGPVHKNTGVFQQILHGRSSSPGPGNLQRGPYPGYYIRFCCMLSIGRFYRELKGDRFKIRHKIVTAPP